MTSHLSSWSVTRMALLDTSDTRMSSLDTSETLTIEGSLCEWHENCQTEMGQHGYACLHSPSNETIRNFGKVLNVKPLTPGYVSIRKVIPGEERKDSRSVIHSL